MSEIDNTIKVDDIVKVTGIPGPRMKVLAVNPDGEARLMWFSVENVLQYQTFPVSILLKV